MQAAGRGRGAAGRGEGFVGAPRSVDPDGFPGFPRVGFGHDATAGFEEIGIAFESDEPLGGRSYMYTHWTLQSPRARQRRQ